MPQKNLRLITLTTFWRKKWEKLSEKGSAKIHPLGLCFTFVVNTVIRLIKPKMFN